MFILEEAREKILEAVRGSPRAMKNPTRFVRETVADLSMQLLKRNMEVCDKCGCHCAAKTLPTGNAGNVPLMCIMDYPTAEQARAGKPLGMFDGDEASEKLLRKLFMEAGIDFNKVFFMNTVACAPSRKVSKADGTTEEIMRAPYKSEIENCSVFMKYAIEVLHPPMLIIMGNVASNVFLKEPITKARGKWIDYYGIHAKLTYSPHYFFDARGQMTNEQWLDIGRTLHKDIDDALAWYKKKWPNSVAVL